MFGIGLSHILLVAVIGLIFIGPEELPQMLRALAKLLGQLKRATDDITSAFNSVSEHGRDYVKEERRLMSETIHADDGPKTATAALDSTAAPGTSPAAPSIAPLAHTVPKNPPPRGTEDPNDLDPAQLSLNLTAEVTTGLADETAPVPQTRGPL